MGKVQKSAFTGDGSTADATKFTMKLSACPDTLTSATVMFDGTPYSGDDTVLALTADTGAATGVGIPQKTRLYRSTPPQAHTSWRRVPSLNWISMSAISRKALR
ncbi:fimbrial protein [Enterobacter mori]|uniref:fimbrial protein n=1 Tax=Enterobacter mori TaxID=539813 RepID=UPI003D68AA78